LTDLPRIAVTGVGLHTGHGDTQATWNALKEGRSALVDKHAWGKGWSNDGESFPVAPAPDPSPTEFLADRKSIKYMGPCTQMAVLAAGRALRDAGLVEAEAAADRQATALYVATGPIAVDIEQALQGIGKGNAALLLAFKQEGLRRCHPLLPFKLLLNMPLGLVSITFAIRGPNAIFYPGAEQGGCALSHAMRGLRRGRFVRALVGGTAQTLSLAPLLGLQREGRLAATIERAQPSSAQHAGWVPADQAAFLVLETEAEAQRRERSPYAFLDDTVVLGADTATRAWQTAGELAPDAVMVTGTTSALEVAEERARAATIWAQRPVLASVDGLLGVAPAASWLLAAALACRALRERKLPAPICQERTPTVLRRILISFHDAEASAAAMLSAPEAGV
jgi:3-oxoacyl-[acyl-carrier-protein] synthase II